MGEHRPRGVAQVLVQARVQFEAMWARVHRAEAVYREWPSILHVRLLSAEWDDKLLMLRMEALPTRGFARAGSPSCGSTWDRIRCTEHGLCSFSWSLHCWAELVAAVIERASVVIGSTPRDRYQVLSDLITDWELDRVCEP